MISSKDPHCDCEIRVDLPMAPTCSCSLQQFSWAGSALVLNILFIYTITLSSQWVKHKQAIYHLIVRATYVNNVSGNVCHLSQYCE